MIHQSYTEIIKKFENNLSVYREENDDIFIFYSTAINCCKDTFIELQETVKNTGFQTKAEEAYFFKNIKTKVCSTMAFFRMLVIVETYSPQHSQQERIEFLQSKLKEIHLFFGRHSDFYEYYKTGQNYDDEKYFTRNFSNLIFNNENFEYIVYPEFSTVHDGTLSKIMAYERLEEYLSNEIVKLKNGKGLSEEKQEKPQSKWTENLTSLAELIYSLIETKAIDHGNISVKELTDLFSQMMEIPEGNIYNAYRLILNRKKEKTVFLDKLHIALAHKIDSSYE